MKKNNLKIIKLNNKKALFNYEKKSFIINTPKKMLNKNYFKFKTKPIEIDLRNILGKTYEISEISKISWKF